MLAASPAGSGCRGICWSVSYFTSCWKHASLSICVLRTEALSHGVQFHKHGVCTVSAFPSVCLPACLPACLCVCLSVGLPACLPVCLSVCLPACLPAGLLLYDGMHTLLQCPFHSWLPLFHIHPYPYPNPTHSCHPTSGAAPPLPPLYWVCPSPTNPMHPPSSDTNNPNGETLTTPTLAGCHCTAAAGSGQGP